MVRFFEYHANSVFCFHYQGILGEFFKRAEEGQLKAFLIRINYIASLSNAEAQITMNSCKSRKSESIPFLYKNGHNVDNLHMSIARQVKMIRQLQSCFPALYFLLTQTTGWSHLDKRFPLSSPKTVQFNLLKKDSVSELPTHFFLLTKKKNRRTSVMTSIDTSESFGKQL